MLVDQDNHFTDPCRLLAKPLTVVLVRLASSDAVCETRLDCATCRHLFDRGRESLAAPATACTLEDASSVADATVAAWRLVWWALLDIACAVASSSVAAPETVSMTWLTVRSNA